MADFELNSEPLYLLPTHRRDFLKIVAGGLSVFLLDAQESGRGGGRGGHDPFPKELAAWLHIGQDGSVQVYTGKVEVGQNARTSLTQAVAEELHVKPAAVQMVMGDTDLVPFDMGTFGSRTTPFMAPQIRKVAAAAREMLLELASQKWSVDKESLSIADGIVSTGTRHANFAELTEGQKLSKTIAPDVKLTPATQWKTLGHDLDKVGARDIVTGKHKFTRDLMRPGMLYGKVIRPPQWNSKLVSVSGEGAIHDGNFVGVVAAKPQDLAKAAAAVKAEWQAPKQIDSTELFANLRPTPTAFTLKAPESATAKVTSTYTVAYIAHTPLETRAAVAEWQGDKLTVWTGTQRPFGVQQELSQAFGIPEERVRVLVPDTGSGYGGKHTGEAAIEAARLAKASGKPVRVTWTREEEFAWAYARPAGVIDISSSAAKDGKLLTWEFHNYNSGGSGLESPYAVDQVNQKFHDVDGPVRQGSYRGLAAMANHFAREVHMDELAHQLGMDPLSFRLKNAANPRLKAVIESAAEKFGWGKTGKAVGISAGFEKGGYVACCAEVNVTDRIQVVRVVEAFECGAVVNPKHLHNQIEGSIVQGLGGALFEHLEFANGMLTNGKLSQYRVPRFLDTPSIDIVMLDRKDLPSAGAGETPIVGIAPAVANAVFSATGKRLRSMPMKLA